ncbi:mannose-6-phosphate isomerase, class I [Thermoflavifilum thermophilum]|uniref:mannose-6-phosphate isomerase n=1 Tax=Thermoflavifilum thermophilum TaxID=1393122 RepID=A0A1I7N0S9_9BACT|nr:mannose-6-phosphate isomerase, class I [Thermoflavifilum thermophilum]SFV28280.1 mannose-6-phosphate isomerase, type 1 [Thermoflavifilum thermophilum]
MNKKLYLLTGKIQHYDWGGYEFIPRLLQIENPQHKPYAEYWLGAHPAASAEILDQDKQYSLHAYIQKYPFDTLGPTVYETFGQLPYLLKVLDVRHMLSIQVHPTKEAAIAGFEKEEQQGIPLHAPHRNFKDRNHKPELMVALSDFWLLHGFRPEADLLATLERVPELLPLVKRFQQAGYQGLYEEVMLMEAARADAMLWPIVKEATRRLESDQWPDAVSDPAYWVAQAVRQHPPGKHLDKGLFSFYLMNIVHLRPGEAIFQGPGVLHAYLRGQNVEIMANSDNVLRGGLTHKHVDVAELLRHVLAAPVHPHIIQPTHIPHAAAEAVYHTPVPDFQLSHISLPPGQHFSVTARTTEILLLLDGHLIVQNSDELLLTAGQSVVLFYGEQIECIAQGEKPAMIFRATVPPENRN